MPAETRWAYKYGEVNYISLACVALDIFPIKIWKRNVFVVVVCVLCIENEWCAIAATPGKYIPYEIYLFGVF